MSVSATPIVWMRPFGGIMTSLLWVGRTTISRCHSGAPLQQLFATVISVCEALNEAQPVRKHTHIHCHLLTQATLDPCHSWIMVQSLAAVMLHCIAWGKQMHAWMKPYLSEFLCACSIASTSSSSVLACTAHIVSTCQSHKLLSKPSTAAHQNMAAVQESATFDQDDF